MSLPLHGRTVVVTGAARGIGRAVADGVAAAGAAVIGIDRSFDDTPSWAHHDADVTDRDAMARILAAAAAEHGRLDGLVNNAGISRRTRIDDLDEETWHLLHGIDLLAPLLLLRDALPYLEEGASIVNVTSIRARRGFAGDVAYLSAKGGLDAATRGLAVELGPRGIRVNCVAPGAIETELNRAVLAEPGHRERTVARIPLGRLGRPEDLAGAVVFLLGDAAAFVTGSVITIDGGQTAMG